MILSGIGMLIAVALPVVCGLAVNDVILRRCPLRLWTRVCLAYGTGLGLIVSWMMILSILNCRYSLAVISGPLLIFPLIVRCISQKASLGNRNTDPAYSIYPARSVESTGLNPRLLIGAAALSFIILEVTFVFWQSLAWLPYTWDEVGNFALKAKIIYFDGHLGNVDKYTYFRGEHPLFIALTEAWAAFALGRWDYCLVKIIFPVMLVSFLGTSYFVLRCFAGRLWSLLGLVFLLSSQFLIKQASIGYADFSMLYYNCTAVMLIILASRYGRSEFLVLAAVFAGIGTLVKSESMGYLFIYYFLVVVLLIHNPRQFNRPFMEFLRFFVISIGSLVFYNICRTVGGIESLTSYIGFEFDQGVFGRAYYLAQNFGRVMFLSESWNIVWFMLAAVLFFRKKGVWEESLLASAILLFILYYGAIGVFTNFYFYLGKNFYLTLYRVVLHFYPLAVFFITMRLGCEPGEN